MMPRCLGTGRAMGCVRMQTTGSEVGGSDEEGRREKGEGRKEKGEGRERRGR